MSRLGWVRSLFCVGVFYQRTGLWLKGRRRPQVGVAWVALSISSDRSYPQARRAESGGVKLEPQEGLLLTQS